MTISEGNAGESKKDDDEENTTTPPTSPSSSTCSPETLQSEDSSLKEDLEEEAESQSEDDSERSRSRSPSPLPRVVTPPRDHLDMVTSAVTNFVSLLLCVGAFGVFLVGSYDYFKNFEENKCDMTWMFRYPKYAPFPVGSALDDKYPMYKLYAYAEGDEQLTEISREGYRFTGIPVLFIPGNAGSHQQVRSLASVALWKYLDEKGRPYHFDFFTVDLNEEFSGLYGYTLERQVEFVRGCVQRIQGFYEDYHRVVLIGHSMGGVIAKAVALEGGGEDKEPLSNLIFTLAAPHSQPLLILDPEQDIFYSSVKKNWTGAANKEMLTLVSVAGGHRDILVPSKFTQWPYNNVEVIATGIPGVWASTDHLCIVWCKQLVLTTVRSLFDMVEFQQRNKYWAVTDNTSIRSSVLNYHFQRRSSGNTIHSTKATQVVLSKNLERILVSSGLYCMPAGQRVSHYAMYPVEYLGVNGTSADHQLIVLTTNTKEKNWLIGCQDNDCLEGDNLSHGEYGRIIPHMRRRRKLAEIPWTVVQTYSHLAIRMDPHPFKTCVMLEVYDKANRTTDLGGTLGVNHGIFYNLTLTPWGFLSHLISWRVTAQVKDNMSCPESHNLLAQFKHGSFEESRFLKNESLTVRYQDWNVSDAHVTLYMEPSCRYTVKTTIAWLETAGNLFRVVVRLLPSFYAGVLLMTLYFQKDPNNWTSFHVLLLSNAYHLSVLPGFLIAVLLHFIPTDWPVMMTEQEYSVAVPVLCFLIAYFLVLAVSTGTWYTIITGGTAVHSVIIRLLSGRFGNWGPIKWASGFFHRGFTSVTEHVTEAAFEISLTRFPLTIAVLLLALSFATCGSLGIALALVLYLVKLFKIYEDLLEDLLKAKIQNMKENLAPMNFQFSCFMLWLMVTVLNMPSLLHWTRSFSTDSGTQWDLSMYLCLLLLPTVAVLWQEFVPKVEPSIWNLHRYAFYLMGVACVLWGTHRLYVTAFIITFVFLTMAICQLVSVMISTLMQQQQQREAQGAAADPRPPPPSSQQEESSTTSNNATPNSAS